MFRFFLLSGGLLGACAVAAGALGTHALRNRLPAATLEIYQTAVEYALWHAVATLACAILVRVAPELTAARVAGCAFIVGTVLFSGSLLVLSLTTVKSIHYLAPIGGLCFIIGWLALAVAGLLVAS